MKELSEYITPNLCQTLYRETMKLFLQKVLSLNNTVKHFTHLSDIQSDITVFLNSLKFVF